MVEVERIGILSLGVVTGVVYAVLGLLVGLLFACVSFLGAGEMAVLMEEATGITGSAALLSVAYALCLPVLYGVAGFIAGVIVALVYNAVAATVGGVRIGLSDADLAKLP